MYGPEIQPEEIFYDPEADKLGTGTYGTVYKGRCRGAEVAVKRPNKQQLNADELAMFREEVKNMSNNSHPNIIRLMGACTEPGRLQIVTERCATDLERLLAEGEYDFHQVMRFARDMAKGMVWLHYSNPPTIHRDLKPANILVDFHDQIKISDFGLAQVKNLDHIRDKPRGSLIWMAPEVMVGKPYTEKIDVYSFGIILWQMATKKLPYQHLSTMKIFVDAICYKHERPPLTEDKILLALQNLIKKCWAVNPEDRYEFYEIVFRLNEIITDAVIKDSDSALLWKRKFLLTGHQELQEQVGWPEFQAMLAEETKLPDDQLAKLCPLIVQHDFAQGADVQYVSMARFYQFVQWFGPFYDPILGKDILEQMIAMQGHTWFHGCITRDQANSRLSGRSKKTFLVRLSTTDAKQFPFSISFPNNEHERIERIGGGLQGPDGNLYKTLPEYVAAFSTKLKYACPVVDSDIVRYRAWNGGATTPAPLAHRPPNPLRLSDLALSPVNTTN